MMQHACLADGNLFPILLMEPTPPPRIEIFAPFGEAFELTRKILFQPFDLAKYLTIAFAAWLATFFSGGGSGYRGYNQDWVTRWKSEVSEGTLSGGTPAWFVPAIVVGGLISLAILVFFLWVNARGRFMFTDCIVRNRGAIAEPWREYRLEGNRYFVLQLVISLASIVVFGGIGLLCFMSTYMGHDVLPFAILIPSGLICLLIAIPVYLVIRLAVPVMYRQRCDVVSACKQVWALIVAQPGIFVLFVLFYIVLYIAAMLIGSIATCITCCIACIPYVGTVILLPVVMVLYAYPLCFIRQFGDPYDVWAGVQPSELPPIPPVQEPSGQEPPPTQEAGPSPTPPPPPAPPASAPPYPPPPPPSI
jgi:hypothetical protein